MAAILAGASLLMGGLSQVDWAERGGLPWQMK